MQLTGDEKRIQALFCELKAEDLSFTSTFENALRHAQARPSRQRQSLRTLAIMTATAIVVTTVCSQILWSQNRHDMPNAEAIIQGNATNFSTSPGISLRDVNTVRTSQQSPRLLAVRRVPRARRQKHFDSGDSIMVTAIAISKWQSPTASLVEFFGSSAFKSLPQLSGSVQELQSFLPSQKERNQ